MGLGSALQTGKTLSTKVPAIDLDFSAYRMHVAESRLCMAKGLMFFIQSSMPGCYVPFGGWEVLRKSLMHPFFGETRQKTRQGSGVETVCSLAATKQGKVNSTSAVHTCLRLWRGKLALHRPRCYWA